MTGIPRVVLGLTLLLFFASPPERADAQFKSLNPGVPVEIQLQGGGPTVIRGGIQAPSAPPTATPKASSKAAEAKKKDEKKKEEEKKKGDEKKDDKPKSDTTTRPDEPLQPADPKELEVRPGDDGRVSFQFQGQTWPDVLEWLAEISNVALDWQELPSDYLNLRTRRPYTVDETRDLINQRLLARGYTILLQGEGLTVVKLEKLNPAMVPRITPEQLVDRMPYDFVKVGFDMDWLVPTEVVKELDTLKSPQGKLTPMPGANRIEAMDAVINLREIYDAITLQQAPDRRTQHVKEFVLEFTRASDVAAQLREFLGMPPASGGAASRSVSYGRSGVSSQQLQQMQQQLIQQIQRVRSSGASNSKSGPTIEAKKVELRVVANERRNSIVVHASPDKMGLADEFIRLVDVRSDQDTSLASLNSRMQIFRLASLDPQELVNSLTALGGLEPRTKLTVDEENNALIVYGSLADQVLIKSVIDRLDGSGRQSEVIQLRQLPADQVAGSIMFLMGDEKKDNNRNRDYYGGWGGYYGSRSRDQGNDDKFKVTANVEYNQLLVWANEIELKEVYNLLEKLGEIQTRDSGSRVRVISAGDPNQMRTFLKQLQQAWPGENKLILPSEDDLPKPMPKSEPVKNSTDDNEGDGGEKDDDAEKEPEEEKSRLQYRDDAALETSLRRDGNIDIALIQDDADPPTPSGAKTTAAKSPPAESKTAETKAAETKGEVTDVEAAQPPMSDSPQEPAGDDPKGNDPELTAQEQLENAILRERLELLKRIRQQDQDERAAESAAKKQPDERSPIRISVNAAGELVFTSDDTAALAMIEQLAEQLAPKPKKFHVFHLEHASAFWVRFNLEDYFEEEEDDDNDWMRFMWGIPSGRDDNKQIALGSKRKPPQFIDDPDTNTILVKNADAEQLETIADLIELYDVKEPVTAANSRFTQVFYIQYSKPSLIEATIKEALKDLLSSNDKALQQQQRQGNNGNNRNGQQQPPPSSGLSIKGKLSIGSDDISRVMIVSCEGEQLMEMVTKMIETLDRAAKPAAAVDMVKVSGGLNMQSLQAALGSFQPVKPNNNQNNGQQQPPQQPNQPQKPPTNNNPQFLESGGVMRAAPFR